MTNKLDRALEARREAYCKYMAATDDLFRVLLEILQAQDRDGSMRRFAANQLNLSREKNRIRASIDGEWRIVTDANENCITLRLPSGDVIVDWSEVSSLCVF
jgi:hypothetical protein